MADAAAKTAFCPHCQAEYQPGAERCWICHQPLEPARPEHAGAPEGTPPSVRRSFHLNTLMVVIALVAVLLGLFRESSGLGVFVAVICLPAALRLRSVAAQRQARDQPMSLPEKIWDFIGSALIAWAMLVMLGICAAVAFLLMCLVGGVNFTGPATQPSWPNLIPVGLPVVVGLVCAIVMGRFLWTRRR
jgi:small-conductance mechanosensitive channel